METKDEMKNVPSFDDLVFENRNKEYGAYQIRRKYNSALIWAILISVFCVSASVVSPFIIKTTPPIVVVPPIDTFVVEIDSTLINMKFQKPEPPQPQPTLKVLKYVAPEVVDTLLDEEENKFATIQEYNENVEDDSIIDVVQTTRVEIDKDFEDNKVKEIVEISEKPFFGTNGDNEFRRWITEKIVYPQLPLENGIQGRVYVQFVVEKDGSLTNIVATSSVDPELGKEAVRVVSLSPKWMPGKQQGVPVRVRYTFPITFSIK